MNFMKLSQFHNNKSRAERYLTDAKSCFDDGQWKTEFAPSKTKINRTRTVGLIQKKTDGKWETILNLVDSIDSIAVSAFVIASRTEGPFFAQAYLYLESEYERLCKALEDIADSKTIDVGNANSESALEKKIFELQEIARKALQEND